MNWYIYNEGLYSGENGTEIENLGFYFTFAKLSTVGKHYFSIYFNTTGGEDRWFNASYTISIVYGLSTVTFFDGQSNVFEDSDYKIYINGTRSPSLTFYNRTDYVYLITITDYFNYEVYSAIHEYERFIDIQIDVYTFKVYSMVADGEYFWFNLTRSGGARFSQHLLPTEILIYRLIAGDYTYDFKTINGANYDFHTGDFTLTEDHSYVITDIGLTELWLEMMRDVGGRTSIKPVMSALSTMSSSLSMLQASLWGVAAIIIGMMVLRGYFGEEEAFDKYGKPIKKKRKVPKQLRESVFKKGQKNPQFKGIPKGAGKDAWTKAGGTFEKDD